MDRVTPHRSTPGTTGSQHQDDDASQGYARAAVSAAHGATETRLETTQRLSRVYGFKPGCARSAWVRSLQGGRG